MSKPSITVRVPASTSNCGPGFDTLGIALTLYNFIRVIPRADGDIRIGEGVEGTRPMVRAAAEAFANAVDRPRPGFDFQLWGEVPPARGLGSSSTIYAGLLAALNQIEEEPLGSGEILRIAANLDNAPDNVCAAFGGGLCIARTDPETFAYREHVRFNLPETLGFVAVSPDYEVVTAKAREVLPATLPFDDTVRSLNSLAFLVGVLVSGEFEHLSGAVHDTIHQPYREKLNPFGRESIAAGCHAGAHTGWLSGSGSTVICAAPPDSLYQVGQAMEAIYHTNNVGARAFRLKTDNTGLEIV